MQAPIHIREPKPNHMQVHTPNVHNEKAPNPSHNRKPMSIHNQYMPNVLLWNKDEILIPVVSILRHILNDVPIFHKVEDYHEKQKKSRLHLPAILQHLLLQHLQWLIIISPII